MEFPLLISYRKALAQSNHTVVNCATRSIHQTRVNRSRCKARCSNVGPGSTHSDVLRHLDLINKPGLTVPGEPHALRGGNKLDLQHTLRICGIGASQELLQIRSSVAVAIDIG